jgi:hypothetical protein
MRRSKEYLQAYLIKALTKKAVYIKGHSQKNCEGALTKHYTLAPAFFADADPGPLPGVMRWMKLHSIHMPVRQPQAQ